MEQFSFEVDGSHMRIDGLPNATRLIALTGHHARQLADLQLHRQDLEFALVCLERFEGAAFNPGDQLHEALWRISLIQFIKCFTSSESRDALKEKKIFQKELPEALEHFRYMKAVRDKHIAHDENPFAQCLPIAALNNGQHPHKVEQVLCLSTEAVSATPESFTNLSLLVNIALAWVNAEFNRMSEYIRTDLERTPYEVLVTRPEPKFTVAGSKDVYRARVKNR